MPDLILPSLEIQNFRAFEHLRIERLGRVNLITGKNNVGKTSLLEALYLYSNGGSLHLLRELLDARDELQVSMEGPLSATRPRTPMVDGSSIKHLFYGRQPQQEKVNSIHIGPVAADGETLTITLDWFQSVEERIEDNQVIQKLLPVSFEERKGNPEARPYVVILRGQRTVIRASLESVLRPDARYLKVDDGSNIYVKANGLNKYRIAELWNNIALSSFEDDVIAVLRIVAPISRVSVIGDRDDANGPIPIIVMKGQQERLPLGSLGDGINRLFGIILSLVNVENGILLLDEIDIGLHYSIMTDVWKLIFQVAQRLNVQVFATTHSWDCIEAFERAAREDDTAEGELIHLMNKEGEIFAVLYDEEELGIVTEEMIEVR